MNCLNVEGFFHFGIGTEYYVQTSYESENNAMPHYFNDLFALFSNLSLN